jgi:hypothetical protein
MNNDKMNEFTKIAAQIGSSMEGLLNAQELLMDLMLKECAMNEELKPHLLENMYAVMGFKKL